MGLKNILVMIVVTVLSVGSAFIFVTRIYSSKDDYAITVSSADSSGAGVENSSEDGKGADTEKSVKPEKVKKKNKKKDKKKDKKGDDENEEKSSNNVLGKILVPMDSIVVNIGSVDSKRYLRVIISLEVKNSEIEGTIKANKVVFRDKLVSFLSSKELSEMSDRANHKGLRVEIRDLLNSDLLGIDDAISQVYFSDFIIQ
jgi:flagellar basal body-associated protein FliL